MLIKNALPLVVWLALGIIGSGCGAGGLAAVREQASLDMQCPEASLEVAAANPSGADNPTDSGLYYAEGCQKLRRYTVGCNIFGYCPEPQGVDALNLVQRQAGFDLQCEPAAIAIQRLNVDTFGATGCGRQASYVLLCAGSCRVVQNTQTQ
jgi:hypothetical protein